MAIRDINLRTTKPFRSINVKTEQENSRPHHNNKNHGSGGLAQTHKLELKNVNPGFLLEPAQEKVHRELILAPKLV